MIIFNGDVLVWGMVSGTERLVYPRYTEEFLRGFIDEEGIVSGWGNYISYKGGKLVALHRVDNVSEDASEESQLLLTDQQAVEFLCFLDSKYREQREVFSDVLKNIKADLSGFDSEEGGGR
ncbi:MAG: hypothetical protein U9P90_03355 [Patescibacteria group bacterium]|nr:hypothetical protein [Patescibacteria group bacterium]